MEMTVKNRKMIAVYQLERAERMGEVGRRAGNNLGKGVEWR